MTAIAWAIVFIGLVFYGAIWDNELKQLGHAETVGSITAISLIVLIVCTIREWAPMTWENPPKFNSTPTKQGKKITPEQLAASGTEHGNQAALFAWAANSVGKYPALKYMFAIPNGFYGSAEQKGKMKAEGLRTGVCDVFLPCQGMNIPYLGLFIEMKIEKYRNHKDGGCKEDQIDFINYATNAGYYVEVCYNWEEARDTLIAYLEGKL